MTAGTQGPPRSSSQRAVLASGEGPGCAPHAHLRPWVPGRQPGTRPSKAASLARTPVHRHGWGALALDPLQALDSEATLVLPRPSATPARPPVCSPLPTLQQTELGTVAS